MNFSRSFTIVVYRILDNGLPPFIRDSKFLFTILFKLVFGKNAEIFLNFKEKAGKLTKKEFADIYEQVVSSSVSRETDLNNESLKKILASLQGKSVLEVGCGRGFLAHKMVQTHKVTACDIVLEKNIIKKYKDVQFKKADIEHLPFKDNSFDTIVTTHTLEHVQHLTKAIEELRRVTRKRLIIVVPQQRPYKYTFDLHLHFFPYPSALLATMGNKAKSTCTVEGGDLVYIEDKR